MKRSVFRALSTLGVFGETRPLVGLNDLNVYLLVQSSDDTFRFCLTLSPYLIYDFNLVQRFNRPKLRAAIDPSPNPIDVWVCPVVYKTLKTMTDILVPLCARSTTFSPSQLL